LAKVYRTRRRKNLIRLGVNNGKAYAYGRTRKGTWAIAQSPIMTTTNTKYRLAKRGYESMMDYFCKHILKFSSLSTPLVETAVSASRWTCSGVEAST